MQKDLSLEALLKEEWLLCNGLGGFASGTISGINSRKYHGLLIGGFDASGNRYLYVGALEERVIINDHRFFISSHKYVSDTIYPRGFNHLLDFEVDGDVATFRYGNFNDSQVELIKKINLVDGCNGVTISYQFQGDLAGVSLGIEPLITSRNIHAVSREAPFLHKDSEEWKGTLPLAVKEYSFSFGDKLQKGLVTTFFDKKERIFIFSESGSFVEQGDWYHTLQYDKEMERGYEYIEDLYSPGVFCFGGESLSHPIQLHFALGNDVRVAKKYLSVRKELQATKSDKTNSARIPADLLDGLKEDEQKSVQEWFARLARQADDFFVEDQSGGHGIIAGYPWFGIWSRDALISLKGLLIDRGRLPEAKSVLETISKHIHVGLVPNILEENSKRYEFLGDSSLWFVLASYWYILASKDTDYLQNVWLLLCDIIKRYMSAEGAHPIMDEDGLIVLIGDGSKAATWMDAIANGHAVTPRYGKPVEIQALWYNALNMMLELSTYTKELREKMMRITWRDKVDESPAIRGVAGLEDLSRKVKQSFGSVFHDNKHAHLADFVEISVEGGERLVTKGINWQVRPNQLFALSLPFPLMDKDTADEILQVVERELLTKAGLKTLSSKEAGYHGYYGGSQTDRDEAYHQGTVWPWLLGPYAKAKLYAYGAVRRTHKEIFKSLARLFNLCEMENIRYIPEVFSADDLHPDGAIHQAWNVGEILDILWTVDTSLRSG